jgi:outer membrane lipoprotein-sorting protein
MKKMIANQKNAVWLLALLLALTVFLWGCGGGEPAPAPEEPAPPEAPQAPAEPAASPEVSPAVTGQDLDESELAALFGSGQSLDELYYEMTMTGLQMDGVTSRIWLKGERMRAETEMTGQQFIMIYDTDAVYTLDTQEKTAIKMPTDAGMGMDASMEPVTADDFTTDVDDQNFQYLGQETINGVMCHVVQSVDRETDDGVKMWLHADYGFPMRVESLSDDPEEQYVMDVTDFRVGSVSDDQFTIPSDYEIIDFSEMFQNMPSMPAVPGS